MSLRGFFPLGGSLDCVNDVRAIVDSIPTADRIMRLRRAASVAKSRACGNCGEYAAVAFDYLMLNGCPYPIEYAGYVSPGDHAFVIVGRPESATVSDPSTWGREAVVCDAWHGNVVRANMYWAEMPSFPHAVHAPEVYIRLVPSTDTGPQPRQMRMRGPDAGEAMRRRRGG
jgi:hypothetical protein